MKRVYSLYEAKAKFSEIVRAVRERGDTITITYHGEPVAEMRPIDAADRDYFQVLRERDELHISTPARSRRTLNYFHDWLDISWMVAAGAQWPQSNRILKVSR